MATVGENRWPYLGRNRWPLTTIPLPAPPVSPLCARSLQVVASPCWAMALPDIISATLVQVLGPIPRRAPRLHVSIP
jgi:hypothetical protein